MTLLDASGQPIAPEAPVPALTPAGVPLVDYFTAPVVPDCRAKDPKGIRWGMFGAEVRLFCANCGAPGGYVPQENMTFAFWLCNPCFETHGAETLGTVIPDEVFYETIKQEQLESYGRLLTEPELVSIVEADASPLATLLTKGR